MVGPIRIRSMPDPGGLHMVRYVVFFALLFATFPTHAARASFAIIPTDHQSADDLSNLAWAGVEPSPENSSATILAAVTVPSYHDESFYTPAVRLERIPIAPGEILDGRDPLLVNPEQHSLYATKGAHLLIAERGTLVVEDDSQSIPLNNIQAVSVPGTPVGDSNAPPYRLRNDSDECAVVLRAIYLPFPPQAAGLEAAPGPEFSCGEPEVLVTNADRSGAAATWTQSTEVLLVIAWFGPERFSVKSETGANGPMIGYVEEGSVFIGNRVQGRLQGEIGPGYSFSLATGTPYTLGSGGTNSTTVSAYLVGAVAIDGPTTE